jgi:hypothetical protein
VNSKEQIRQIIYDAITTVNETLPSGRRLELCPDTVIIEEFGKFDSIDLVNFMAAVETGISRKFHQTISLFDLIFLTAADVWTVASIAECLAAHIDALAPEAQRAASPARA